jgi:hypothetical protein
MANLTLKNCQPQAPLYRNTIDIIKPTVTAGTIMPDKATTTAQAIAHPTIVLDKHCTQAKSTKSVSLHISNLQSSITNNDQERISLRRAPCSTYTKNSSLNRFPPLGSQSFEKTSHARKRERRQSGNRLKNKQKEA